ncbi:MAG: methylmalonyl Co-A mutase-associated GTPase MeaB [Vicinamibacterales bacterium]
MAGATLSERLLAGDPRAIARAISLIEDESSDGAALVGRIYEHTGRAYLIGVTGPPGAGKSTLVEQLTRELRKTGVRVGVLAVDPTSPYSGGAILGDRVRMQMHAEDAGVFIRSMATRGHLGGLARTTAEAALVLDAAGYDIVIIETVGVGQDEVDIVRTADISIVTVVPGTGDEVQALKAGIMEIADIFVVNKADREGADRTASSIEVMLSLESWAEGTWRPPVLRTVATTGAGVPDLVETIARFRRDSRDQLGERRRARAEWRLREILGRGFMQHLDAHVLAPGEFEATLERIADRRTDPYTAADGLLTRAVAAGGPGLTLDHVGIAVPDAAPFVERFRDLFGLATDTPEDVGQHRVRFVGTGGATLELVEPLTPEAPVAKFLASRGAGLHHLCVRVPDIDRAIADLTARGVRFIDTVARAGAHGSRIAFIHPSSAQGLLIELKQLAAVTPDPGEGPA